MADGGSDSDSTRERLRHKAQDFADQLTHLLNGTVTTAASVTVYLYEDVDEAVVAPGAAPRLSDAQFVPLSISKREDERNQARLWLNLRFRVALDDELEHLTVQTSVFGLCIKPSTGFQPLRIEYDRNKTAKQAAHVQIHGESAGLAYAYAAAGREFKRLDKLHIPVGGRRFRPSLEDFIEFLYQEGLITKLHPGWRGVLETSRGDWLGRQTRAAVRREPEAAAEQLRLMGYQVTAPNDGPTGP